MSAGADATPPPVGDRASPDKRPSGFTAVNRSPSNSSAHGNEAGSNGRPDGQDAEADMTSGKRKQPEAVSNTQKRARLSPSAPPAGTYERSNGQANGAAPQRPADDSSWPDHNRNGSTTSDAQLAEVLTSNMSGHAAAPGVSSPEAYQGHNVQGEAAYTQAVDGKYSLPPGTTAQQLQRGSGLRKRNFSNRTKTGCLTCRERKKKCDERKPHCANCERGGFICKGYSTNGSYKGNVGSQLPLQPSQHGYPPQYGYQPHVPAAYYDQNAPPPPGQPPHPQDPHARSQGYPNPQWTGAALPHYPQDPLQRQEYQPIAAHPQAVMSQPPMGALPEMQRQHPSKMPPPPEPVHPPHNRSNSTHSAYGAYGSHPLPNGQPFQYSSQRVTAQLALDHASTTREPATEKGKMLAAFPYNQRDPELKQDRYECAQRVYRFNKNAGEPGLLGESSRRDQLRQIIEPPVNGSPGSRKSSSPRSEKQLGHLGNGVEVEAPFYCEYGYNITIKDDVEIGPNCRIMDASSVEIGERTIIGPDVKILTTDGHHDNLRHPGQKRMLRAQKIKIGKDVFIGAGAIILPGRTIADGATIGAGTIVHHDVKGPYTFINNLDERKPKNAWSYQHQQHQHQQLQQAHAR